MIRLLKGFIKAGRHNRIIATLVGILILTFPLLYWGIQKQRAEYHYQHGIISYFAGNLKEAQKELESAYALSKEKDVKIRKLLIRVLMQDVLSYYERKEYQESLNQLLRIQKLGEETEEINKLSEAVRDRMKSEATLESSRFSLTFRKKIKNLTDSERWIVQIIRNLDQQRNEELKQLSKERNQERQSFSYALSSAMNSFRQQFWFGLILLFLLTLLTAALAGYFFRKILLQSIPLLQELSHQYGNPMSALTAEMNTQSLLGFSGAKADKIIAIEAELTLDDDKKIAEKLLKQFLEDKNPWVKAKAAKALYRYYSDPAMNVLKELIQTKQGQVPAVLALGEIGKEECLDLIIQSFPNFDKKTEKAALQALLRLSRDHDVEKEVADKIEQFFKEIKIRGDWVI